MSIAVCNTSGTGLWSSAAKPVSISKIDIVYTGGKYAELQVFFDPKTWNVAEDGLIYTDPLWLDEFKRHLINAGYNHKSVDSVDYTEQGMQGNDYVSLDVAVSFLTDAK